MILIHGVAVTMDWIHDIENTDSVIGEVGNELLQFTANLIAKQTKAEDSQTPDWVHSTRHR